MQTPKLKLLIFISFLLEFNSAVSMETKVPVTNVGFEENNFPDKKVKRRHTNRRKKTRKRRTQQQKECLICQGQFNPDAFHQLTCGHEACKTCMKKYIATQYKRNVLPTCIACNKNFVNEEYDRLMSLDREVATNLKNRYQLQEADLKWENRKYRTVPQKPQTSDQIQHMIKILAIPVVLGSYGLYKFLSHKKQTNTAPSKEHPSPTNWFSKQISFVKENASDIIATSLVTTALFALLTQQSINLVTPMNQLAVNVLGNRYLNFLRSIERNIFLGPIKAQFDNGIVLNAGLSLSATLIARFCYKLLDGSSAKRNKKTGRTLKE